MQLKRILAIFLAVALILSALTFSVAAESLDIFEVGVAAETTTPVSSSPVIYNAGEDVTVTISAVQNTGFDYLKIKVSYDPEALDYVGYTTNQLFGNDNLEEIVEKKGYVIFTAILNDVSTATGDMFTLNLKTKDGFCGETKVIAQLSQDNENNCMITDPDNEKVVPFVGGSSSFIIHNTDVTAGIVTAPTCTNIGYTTYHCVNCEENIVGNTVVALGHSAAAIVEENHIEPTCTENGSYDNVVYCSVCNEELSRETMEIEATGHTLTDAVEENHIAPTCTKDGSYEDVVYCSACGEELSREAMKVGATGHIFGEAVEENRVEPTCTENGAYDTVVYCSVCGEELSRETIEISATDHAAGEAVEENRVNPTCTQIGSYDTVVYCITCDEELSRKTVVLNSLGHDLVVHNPKTPTCTEIGWDAYITCSRCDYTTYTEKAALGHDLINHEAQAPTCTEIGWDAYDTCSRCDYTTYAEKAALGHDLINHEAQAPTCTEIGWDAYDTCSRCDYTTYIENDSLTAHTYKSKITKATLSKNGKKEYVCQVCGYVSSKSSTIYRPYSFKLSATTYTYDGKVKKPTVTVKDYAGKVISSSNYTVTYASGRKNVGEYKVTLKFKGNYSGTKTITFKINPVKTTVSKLTAGTKSIKVNITKKSTQVTGYQIYYSTSKSFSSNVVKKYITSYKTTSINLSGLSANKTYYVKVRTYKTVNGTKYYSGWSTIKYTKTK